jgi:cytochrome c oxidase subunit III
MRRTTTPIWRLKVSQPSEAIPTDPHASHGEHGHNSLVAHHFCELEQQQDANTLGMWVFLATEVMFIGAIFIGFFSYRIDINYFNAFKKGSANLVTWIGAVNTAVLLTSSLTVVLAIQACKTGKKNQIVGYLIATWILGFMFFGFKVLEYKTDWDERLWPVLSNGDFRPVGEAKEPKLAWANETEREHAAMFYRFYYALTGLHAFHMLVGLGIFTYLIGKAMKGKFTPDNHQQVEICGLYWHFVDLVWIFLFPLLYLIK